MKSITQVALLVLALGSASYAAGPVPDVQDGQTGTLMVLPPRQTDTGTKRIPDPAHPFIAPGPNDQRGPCPAMNTLANHGYISRNGITTFEEIITAAQDAFNFDQNVIAGMAAVNFLARGNVFVNKISIGSISKFVPPSPGKIDGPETQGIAKHGRVEGDALSGTGHNLEEIAEFADDGPDGPHTVVNLKTLIELKRKNIEYDQAHDRQFSMPLRRYNAVFAAPALLMTVFANGTTGQTTPKILTSFFAHQTFPPNWFRAASPVLASPIGGQIAAGLPEWVPGSNDPATGVFVPDPPPPAPFNTSLVCSAYWDQIVNGIPGSLVNTTGVFKQNVDLLTGIMFAGSKCTQSAAPGGPTNV
ncbi:Chloroperoxidase [Mycena filopes]|nr:Chloroperoxidase [Mycena filopes]